MKENFAFAMKFVRLSQSLKKLKAKRAILIALSSINPIFQAEKIIKKTLQLLAKAMT